MARQLVCEECKKDFISNVRRESHVYKARYCSVKCRIKAQRGGKIDMSQGLCTVGKLTLPSGMKKLSDARRFWNLIGIGW